MENMIMGLLQLFFLVARTAFTIGTVMALLAEQWVVVLVAALLAYMALNIGTAGWLGEYLAVKFDRH
jgi:membrane-bound acyltransferase YfiQ involved in biofilm formation